MELINKYRSKEYDRVVIVELTDKGRELKDQVLEVPDNMSCGLQLNSEEVTELKRYLSKMLEKF